MGFLNDIFYNPRTHDLMNPKKFQTILFLIRILRWANTIFSISKHFSFIKDFHLYYNIFRAVLQSEDLQLQSLFSDIQKYSADPPQRTCRHLPHVVYHSPPAKYRPSISQWRWLFTRIAYPCPHMNSTSHAFGIRSPSCVCTAFSLLARMWLSTVVTGDNSELYQILLRRLSVLSGEA